MEQGRVAPRGQREADGSRRDGGGGDDQHVPVACALESDGAGGRWIKVSKAMQDAFGAGAGETVSVEITRIDDEPEVRLPEELGEALAAAPRASAAWADITPIARRDWVLWISTAKQEETRGSRVEKACDMLTAGKRRVCCFPGLTWLRKEHPNAGEPWSALPKSKRP